MTIENTIHLQWCRLQFDITPIRQMQLSVYPATTIRGGLGYILKEDAKNAALYEQLYEEREGEKIDGSYMAYNRPIVIRTKRNNHGVYQKGEHYSFEMILFGEAIAQYRAIINAMEKLGMHGIGKGKDLFQVQRVIEHCIGVPKMIYDDGEWIGVPTPMSWQRAEHLFEQMPRKVKLQLMTPLKLQVAGKLQSTIQLPSFIENVSRRVVSLQYYHQAITNLSFVQWAKEQAEHVTMHYAKTKQVTYERFSTRQNQKVPLEGIEGELIIEGEVIAQLFPLLYVGQFCHVGKQAMFGLGEYELTIYE